jgi:hypothetical protein
VADDLYALPPAEFTRARDERAKALRKEGKREEADAVKALRKPTVAAWALNQLAHRRAKDLERLLAAGEKLRAAQEELLAGGDRGAFQTAAAKERDEVAKLASQASELAAEAGERATPALREKISATLHAAALDEETGEELRAGRLVREREAIGGFGGMTAAAPGRGAPAKRAESGSNDSTEGKRKAPEGFAKRGGKVPDGSTKQRKASRADTKRGEDAKRRAEAERRAAAERRQRLAAARTDERHARRELGAANKAIAHAETRAEAARVHAEEANARAKTTAERLKEARRERAAAKKAHAREERALAEAERGA